MVQKYREKKAKQDAHRFITLDQQVFEKKQLESKESSVVSEEKLSVESI